MFAATGFIVKHRKKIIAILIVVALLLIIWLDSQDDCLPETGSGGGSGPTSSEGLAYPVDKDAPITSPFGPRGGEAHNGMDLAPPLGAPIYAFADGTVIAAQDTGVSGFGGWVVVLHEIDGREMSTVYGHEDPGGVLVSTGQTVEAGEHIARVGNSGYSTGPHLHFELYEGNRLAGGTPIDPAPWVERARSGAPAGGGGAADDQDDDAGTSAPGTSENDPTTGSDPQTIRDLRASQIIDVGQQRDEPEMVIVSAISAGMVESELHNLASDAVPESKNYPNDGVAPGDYDSVGLFQQRFSVWGAQAGGIAGLMDPAQQINWYYDAAANVPHDSVGQIAADVENPAAQYRGKYAQREAEAVEYYERLSGNAAGSLAAGSAACGGGSLADIPSADGLGRRILLEAKAGFGLPYVWGGGNTQGPTNGLSGTDPLGYDCSGLTQFAVYQATGGQIELPRTADQQGHSDLLQEVSWDDARPGDLLFFGTGSFHHVSIYSGEKDGADMQYEAQTFGVPVGEYEVWQPPNKVMRVVLDEASEGEGNAE